MPSPEEFTRESDQELYRGCFACGTDNPIGLRLTFTCSNGSAKAVFTPAPEHRGYPGRLHGGLICTLLDEAMAYATKGDNGQEEAYTARLEVRFQAPVPLEEPVTVEAHVVRARGRLVELEARMVDAAGQSLATATGKYMTGRSELRTRRSELRRSELMPNL